MRHAILIHAHHLPEQFGRLCRALSHPDFDIYANIDAKSDIGPFRKAAPQVRFIAKRTDIRWGHWSQVKATLDSLREIVSSGKGYGYVIFISGQDYPVRPLGQIAEFLQDNHGKEFIGYYPANQDGEKNARKLEKRYVKRWVHLRSRNLSAAINRILGLLPDKTQPYLMYKGSQWWNLTLGCVQYILDFCEANPKLIRSYRYTDCADEFFFHSLLQASPFSTRMVNRYFRYIDWSDPVERPKTLVASDFDKIISSEAWFARKVDQNRDSKLLDMLDQNMDK